MRTILPTCSILCALFVVFALTGCTEQTSLVGSDQTPTLDQARSASKKGATKFTFHIVDPFFFSEDGEPDREGELEASSKENKKVTYTTCSYFSLDYVTYLGYYESDQWASQTGTVVRDFCLKNYPNRSL